MVWFQVTHHLKGDGVVGATTWVKLGEQLVYQGHGNGPSGWSGGVSWYGTRLPNGAVDSHRFFVADNANPRARNYFFIRHDRWDPYFFNDHP